MSTEEAATPRASEPLPPAPESNDRCVAARNLDVVRRTVTFGLRNEACTRSVRYLDRTCGRWLVGVNPAALAPGEVGVLEDLKQRLARWSDQLSLGARSDLLCAIALDLERLSPLLGELAPPAVGQVKAELLPRETARRAPPEGSPRSHGGSPGEPRPEPPSRPAAPERQEAPAAVDVGSRSAEPLPAPDVFVPGTHAGTEPSEPQAPAAPTPEPPPDEETEDLSSSLEEVLELDEPSEPGDLAPLLASAEPSLPAPAPAGPSAQRRGKARRDEERDTEGPPEEPGPRPVFNLHDPLGPGMSLSAWGRVPFHLREALERASIRTVADLMLLPPTRYELLPRAVSPSEPMSEGTAQVVRATIGRRVTRLRPLGRIFEVVLTDGQALVTCRWAGQADEGLRQRLLPGARVAVYGVVEHEGDSMVLHQGEPVWLDSRGQGRLACYGVPDVADADMRSLVRAALDQFSEQVLDTVPDEIRQGVRLLDLGEALRRMHLPNQSLRRGRERLAFDELLLYQLGQGLRRRRTPQERGISHTVSHKLVSQLQMANPMVMNDDQEIAFSEIRRDLARPRPMNRLLQGEVGTGKGVIAMMSAVMVAESRSQVVFVTPDPLAAEHRFLFAEPLLRSVGLVPALIPDRPTAAQADALKRGEIHVVVATARLAKTWPEFKRLGLVIVEERGEHGVIGLADLPSRGARPDLLVMTAAPLPTSLTLTVFGAMDLSLVGGTGVGNARCEIVRASDRVQAYTRVREELEQGRQAYVVLPLRGEEALDQKDLARYVDALRSDAFPGARIGVFSGVKSREERQRVFLDFRHRRLDVLLTTTIIEDGPRVANATAMIVEHADAFDLIRLHRLRAHVGRGVRPGVCCLILPDEPDAKGQANVELIVRETEGFRIAEVDLAQRGAGALLGGRAREVPQFRYVDPLDHRELLVRARAEAFDLVASDPSLANPRIQPLRAELEANWERWFAGKPTLARVKKPNRGSGRRRRRA